MDALEVLHQLWHVAGGLAVGRVVALWLRERRERREAAQEAAERLGAEDPRGRRRGYRRRVRAWLRRQRVPAPWHVLAAAAVLAALALWLSDD